MWHPQQRKKHTLPKGTWPSKEEAIQSQLFSPYSLGEHTASSRTWVPAMVPWRASESGEVTQDVIDWYQRFAEGKPGVLVVEATGIRDIASGPLLRIGDDRFVPGLQKLVGAVREASEGQTILCIQLIDFLAVKRRPPRDKFLLRFLETTKEMRKIYEQSTSREALENNDDFRKALCVLDDAQLAEILDKRQYLDMQNGYRERVDDMHLAHIRDLPSTLPPLFADAAVRAEAAGFHGVELHYAHAYTMASFLSKTNQRSDAYGGNVKNRLRLPLEVLSAVKERVPKDTLVGLRYLGDEVIEGGSRLGEAIDYGIAFAKAGASFLSLSKGGKFDDAKQPKVGEAVYPYTGQSGYECMPTRISDEQGPFARNVLLAASVKEALLAEELPTPVVTAGGFCEFTQMEAVLQKGQADFVASARQTLADPDWFQKMRTGNGADIRRCDFTNYCEGLDQKHKQVTCKLWDRKRLDEPDVVLDKSGKRRLVAPK